jgi:hypothetical protein
MSLKKQTVFEIINIHISPVPSYLQCLLTKCAFDNFIALEKIEEADFKEIEEEVILNYEKLRLDTTDFHKYYDLDEKQNFKLKNGHRKLLNGIREKIGLKGSEFFASLMSPTQNPTQNSTITHLPVPHDEKEIKCEVNKIRALITTIMAQNFELGDNDIESILRITVKKEDEKFSASVCCPVSTCDKILRLYMEVRKTKKGPSCRWVLGNFKKHLTLHTSSAILPPENKIRKMFEAAAAKTSRTETEDEYEILDEIDETNEVPYVIVTEPEENLEDEENCEYLENISGEEESELYQEQ